MKKAFIVSVLLVLTSTGFLSSTTYVVNPFTGKLDATGASSGGGATSCIFTITSSSFSGIAATTGEVGSCSIPANANLIGETIAIEGTTFAFSGVNTSTLKFCLEKSGGGGTTCDVRIQFLGKQATNTQTNDTPTNPTQSSFTLVVGAQSSSELLNTLNAGSITIKVMYVVFQ